MLEHGASPAKSSIPCLMNGHVASPVWKNCSEGTIWRCFGQEDCPGSCGAGSVMNHKANQLVCWVHPRGGWGGIGELPGFPRTGWSCYQHSAQHPQIWAMPNLKVNPRGSSSLWDFGSYSTWNLAAKQAYLLSQA